MHFDRSDLQQLTPEYVQNLSPERKAALVEQLRKDLIEAQDRLNQNPTNSSRPSSSKAPWDRSINPDDGETGQKSDHPADKEKPIKNDDKGKDQPNSPSPKNKPCDDNKKKPGKQPGAPGFGRTQKLIVTHQVIHRPECCKGCNCELGLDLPLEAKGGHYTIDLVLPQPGTIGLQGTNTKHIYGSIVCACGFETITSPHRVAEESGCIVYYTVGPRTLEVAKRILEGFKGTLMTDGLAVYRWYEDRLRCWAHLDRKAVGLEESWDKEAATFGAYAVKAFKSLYQCIYKMREMEPSQRQSEQKIADEIRLNFIYECLQRNNAEHEASRAFAVEILNDKDVIFRQITTPEFPLTNNTSENALRNIVILRKMCQGAKTEEGSKAITCLASVVDTLRLRKREVWSFLAEAISKCRSGQAPPPIPHPV